MFHPVDSKSILSPVPASVKNKVTSKPFVLPPVVIDIDREQYEPTRVNIIDT
jgi:hypothetical protein